MGRTTLHPHDGFRVRDVLKVMAAGVPEPEILEDYAFLESEDTRAGLEFAAEQVSFHKDIFTRNCWTWL